MKGRMFALAVVPLLFASTIHAQSLPNRQLEVSNLVTGKYAGQLNGDENRRREVLGRLCGDLNLMDAGNWGELVKSDRNPPTVPSDILVWKPTREHVDVLTDSGPAWIVHEVIPAAWTWLPCPAGGPSTPPPVVSGPPTGPPPSGDVSELLTRITIIEQAVADIRQQNLLHETAEAAERAQAAQFREDVKHAWRDRFVFLGKYVAPLVSGVLAGWKLQ